MKLKSVAVVHAAMALLNAAIQVSLLGVVQGIPTKKVAEVAGQACPVASKASRSWLKTANVRIRVLAQNNI